MKSMKARSPMSDFCPAIWKNPAARIALVVVAALVLFHGTASAEGRADAVATVSLSLSKYSAVTTIDAGSMAGVRPGVIRVHVGDRVEFVNDDTDHHTATALVNAVSFVDDPRWTDDALHASGKIGPGFWSTGDLAPGQRSTLVAAKPGRFLFGCFFDYGAGMRGEIIVEP
jgi:plastocyanin